MADKVKVQFEIDEKLALKAINNLNSSVDGFAKDTKKRLKGIQFDIIAGNLIASGITKSLGFLKDKFDESFDAAIRFESGLIEVGKTSNLTDKELKELGKEIEKIAEIVPVSTRALLENAKVAGQLGVVGSKNILKFAETIAKLGKVSNLEGELAASTLARILNITREGTDSIDTFASVIVSLGNNFAATESEIARVTNEVARATAQFGVSSAEAAALAATLKSIGVRAEEAGGVISKTFQAINKAVKLGGKGLKQLEKITGESGEELQKQFGEDAIGVFQKFILGLQRMGKEGKIVGSELDILGITGLRVSKVLPPLAANADEFARALNLANSEVQNATALNIEFNRALKSGESQSQLLSNAVEKLQRKIGDKLVNAFKSAAPLLISFVKALSETRVETFARQTEDVKILTKEIEILRNKIQAINADDEISFFEADPKELAEDIRILQMRIAGINTNEAQTQLKVLEKQLINLRSQAAQELPQLKGILPDEVSLENQSEIIKEKITNLKNFIALQNNELNALNERSREEDAENAFNAELNKFDALAEIKLAQKEREAEDVEAEKLARTVERDEDFLELESSLGRKEAARVLFRAKELKQEGKHTQAKKLLADSFSKAEASNAKRDVALAQRVGKAKVAFATASANALISLSGSSGVAQFLLQKAVAFGSTIVLGRLAVAQAAAAAPPPANLPLIAAQEKINLFNLATIAATSVGQFAQSFQQGGFVQGPSSGDRVGVKANGGEAILTTAQQRNFMSLANGQAGGNNVDIINALNNLARATGEREIVVMIDEREVFRAIQSEINAGSSFTQVGVA